MRPVVGWQQLKRKEDAGLQESEKEQKVMAGEMSYKNQEGVDEEWEKMKNK